MGTGCSPKQIAVVFELTEESVDSIIHYTQQKIRTTKYHRMAPLY